MTDSEKELVRRLREHKEPNATWHVDRDCTEAADAIERLVKERDFERGSADRVARERDEARAERDRDCIALGLEIKALRNDAEAAEAEVKRLRELCDLKQNLTAEVVRLRKALKIWQDAYATGRNEPLAIAANVTRNELEAKHD